MKPYQHIFFDLDHTLWDFHKNSEETLYQLYHDFNLNALGAISVLHFIDTYKKINHQLWADYQRGEITKEYLRDTRFRNAFLQSGFNGEHIAKDFSEAYLAICPVKGHLLPNAREVLDYLHAHYSMSIITNGFVEAQQVKMKHAGIDKYFSHIFISELIGYQKPDPRIFDYATTSVGFHKSDTIMIGDNYETDILGAINAGIDHIYFNPQKTPHELNVQKEIFDLKELVEHL